MNSAPPDTGGAVGLSIDSPAQELIGYDIDMSAPDGSVRVIMAIADKHLNRVRSLHGGIVAMMLDAAAGFAVSRSLSPQGDAPLVTVSLNTQFIAPAQSGTVIATGSVSGGGRSIRYADAELRTDDGALLAKASGVFKAIRRDRA